MNLLSIVVPLFKSEMNVDHAVERLEVIRNNLKGYQLEVIFVDDGSPDRAAEKVIQHKKDGFECTLIKFTRNFGYPYSLFAGLDYAKGDCVTFVSADMQDPPEMLYKMLEMWKKGKKLVVAERTDSEEPFRKKIFSNTFHKLMRKFALPNYPSGGSDLFLMDRQVVEDLKKYPEKNTNALSLVLWLGYDYDKVTYIRPKREYGKSSWTFSKKFKLFIDSFISFSYVPIRMMSLAGLFVACISFMYGVYILFSTLFFGIEVKGYASLVVIVTFLLGVIMTMLGIIGEYLWRIMDEVRKRPGYIIDEIY